MTVNLRDRMTALLDWGRSLASRDLLQSLSNRAPWSALTRLGNSYLVKATIAAPFLGSVIIFNENISTYFDFSNQFLADIGKQKGTEIVSEYAFKNLYYIYFGLFFLGIGSFIYSIYCPDIISRFPFIDEYSRSRVGLNSPTLCVSAFESVADAYARAFYEDHFDPPTRTHSISYNEEISSLTYSLLQRIHSEYDWAEWDEDPNDADQSPQNDEHSISSLPQDPAGDQPAHAPDDVPPSAESTVDEDDHSPWNEGGGIEHSYVNGAGYIEFGHMAYDLVHAPRVLWGITMPVKDISFKFQSDVYHLHYMITDSSLPYQRITCAFAYFVGFLLLFIPSAETFVRVLVYVV